jgi:hypothetical protein
LSSHAAFDQFFFEFKSIFEDNEEQPRLLSNNSLYGKFVDKALFEYEKLNADESFELYHQFIEFTVNGVFEMNEELIENYLEGQIKLFSSNLVCLLNVGPSNLKQQVATPFDLLQLLNTIEQFNTTIPKVHLIS